MQKILNMIEGAIRKLRELLNKDINPENKEIKEYNRLLKFLGLDISFTDMESYNTEELNKILVAIDKRFPSIEIDKAYATKLHHNEEGIGLGNMQANHEEKEALNFIYSLYGDSSKLGYKNFCGFIKFKSELEKARSIISRKEGAK